MGRGLALGCAVIGALLAVPEAKANDGFGGLSATGLTFSQTDAIAMEEEDLFIGMEEIRVSYVFRNLTSSDVTGEVIFPMPPVFLGQLMMSDYNLPADRSQPDLIGFEAVVDGQPVPVRIDRIAVIEPGWEENRRLSDQYDSPGRDVTDLLLRYGLPLTPDIDAVQAVLARLPQATWREMADQGLLEVFGDAEPLGINDVMPLWSVVARYHWTQTFPAGQVLRVSHRYDNRPPGGIFGWQDPPVADWLADPKERYCIDAATSRGIARRLAGSQSDGTFTGMGWHIAYVLRTANSWAGPIGRFRLTLDKGSEANILSLCADDITKTGPTTFELERRDFSPDRDLEILIVSPLEG